MNKKLNGILWILLCIFFVGVMIRGITGKDWRNFKFWTWHIDINDNKKSSNEITGDNTGDFTSFVFDADKIDQIEIEMISENLEILANKNSDSIEVEIENNVDIEKYYSVFEQNKKLSVSRKKHKKVNFNGFNLSGTHVIIRIPDVLFDSIKIDNVSGSTNVNGIKARKINIDNVSGKINAENLEGKLQLNNVSGKIDFSLNKLRSNFTAKNVSGKIYISLPPDADFIADYETVSGSIQSDFKKSGKKEGEIKNGSETYNIKLETVSGSIEVRSN